MSNSFLTSYLDRAHNVTIHNKGKQLRADSQHEFTCEALGSRPAAVLTWWLDEEQFEPQFNKVQIVSILDILDIYYLRTISNFQFKYNHGTNVSLS